MTVPLIPLPYALDGLEPHVSSHTLELHHGAHHKSYVEQTNAAVAGTDLEHADLNEIVRAAAKSGNAKVFNAASQAWNHGFYWKSLTPRKTEPAEALRRAIAREFGSMEALRAALKKAATEHFASGWAWLVADEGKLCVISTHDAHSPFSNAVGNPLLTVDVWEHAYYRDVQNKRPDYVGAVVDNCLDWGFASENYQRGSTWRYPAE